MSHITMTDLIQTLRTAAASPEAHSQAQQGYFSKLRDDSVLVNRGYACSTAGYLILQEYVSKRASDVEIAIVIHSDPIDQGGWVKAMLGLTEVEAALAFSCNTHYEIHLLLADLLEAGLRLPGEAAPLLSCDATYTEFQDSYLKDEDRFMDLQETLDWMRSIAK